MPGNLLGSVRAWQRACLGSVLGLAACSLDRHSKFHPAQNEVMKTVEKEEPDITDARLQLIRNWVFSDSLRLRRQKLPSSTAKDGVRPQWYFDTFEGGERVAVSRSLKELYDTQLKVRL